jgi:hypothetical protein
MACTNEEAFSVNNKCVLDNIASGQEQEEKCQLKACSEQQRSMEHGFRGQRTDDRWLKVLNTPPASPESASGGRWRAGRTAEQETAE